MTTAESGEDRATATAVVDLKALAVDVAAAAAGPRSGPADAAAVADVLRRRTAGASYAEIAVAVADVSEKRAAAWCKAAQRLDARFDARQARPRKVRAGAKQRSTRMFSARLDTDLVELVERRAAAEGRSVTSMVDVALRSYVGRKVAGVETMVRRELRKALKPALIATKDALGRVERELVKQGINLNQLAHHVNGYGELPVAWLDELEATRSALDVARAELRELRAAIDRSVS